MKRPSSLSYSLQSRMSLGKHLALLIENAKISLQELALNTGVPASTLHRLINDPACNPTIASLIPIATYFRISVDQLLTDAPLPHDGWIAPNPNTWRSIPLIDICTVSSIAELKKKLCNHSMTDIVKTDMDISESSFAIKMYDQSMFPLFRVGAMLVIDPAQKPKDNAYVLAFLKKESCFIFRQIYSKQSTNYLKALNTTAKGTNLTKIDKEIEILGTLAQAIISF